MSEMSPSSVQEKSGWEHNPTLVFLAAAGIQSPLPHPNTWDNAGVVHTGPVPLAERRGVLRIPTKSIEIKGSGFPLRRERRAWSPGRRRCRCDCPEPIARVASKKERSQLRDETLAEIGLT